MFKIRHRLRKSNYENAKNTNPHLCSYYFKIMISVLKSINTDPSKNVRSRKLLLKIPFLSEIFKILHRLWNLKYENTKNTSPCVLLFSFWMLQSVKKYPYLPFEKNSFLKIITRISFFFSALFKNMHRHRKWKYEQLKIPNHIYLHFF